MALDRAGLGGGPARRIVDVASLGPPRHALPDDPGMHEAALAFLADYGSHFSVVRALGDAFEWERFASLDQGLWVHGPVRWNDWWLVVSESEIALDGHTFTRRRIFDRNGRPVATGSQEGIHPDR